MKKNKRHDAKQSNKEIEDPSESNRSKHISEQEILNILNHIENDAHAVNHPKVAQETKDNDRPDSPDEWSVSWP